MVDAGLLTQYDVNIPEHVSATSARIDALDAEIMNSALEQRFAGKKRLGDILQEMTACYSFFRNLYQRWEPILKNQEDDAYMEVKARIEGKREKFVSAAAEREASTKVKEIRYVVGYYEGQVLRAQEYINTCKKLLESIDAEERTT